MKMNPRTTIEFDKLSLSNIDKVEEALQTDKLQSIEDNYKVSISFQYFAFAKLGYTEMLKETTKVTSYLQFAFNAGGMRTYGFYKAKNSKIYIIDSWLGDIENIFIPDKNIECFMDIIE